MIVVARFDYPHEAQIARMNLEASGIFAFIADENTINMQWLYSNAMGGVRLFVNPEDFEEAQSILKEDFSDVILAQCPTTKPIFKCDECGSSHLMPYTKGKKPAFWVFIFLGFPLFFYKHGFLCQKCLHFQCHP